MSKIRQHTKDKFNFFVPCDIIKKSDKEKEDGVVYIDGIASSASVRDADDEVLMPLGFNVKPLLETGLVNFNHQGFKDANANIGICTEAKVINKGQDLYVKCMLWPCAQTEGIVRAYENFKKYAPNRKIGYSVEGNCTQRDPFDSKKILKADITGLAVTFSQKNKNTLMNIIKGDYSVPYVELDDNANGSYKPTEESTVRSYGPGVQFINVDSLQDLEKLSSLLEAENDLIFQKSGQRDQSLSKAIDSVVICKMVPESIYTRLRAMNIILQKNN